MFYGFALIGNFIKMSNLKCTLDIALTQTKNTVVSATEIQLDFLLSKLFHGDKKVSHEFYDELIELIETSSIDNKDEIVEYLKKRYSSF